MSLAEAIIGWLAPAECLVCGLEGSDLCLACQQSEILNYGERCFGCGSLSPGGRSCKTCRRGGAPSRVWVTAEHGGAAQSLIAAFKFAQQRACANQLSQLMVETLELYNSEADLVRKNYLVCHIPTATSRVRQRGFDHAQMLARQVANRRRLERASLLNRQGQAKQVGASRALRLKQAKAAYKAINKQLLVDRNILLIDDVVTTGATLTSAAHTLRLAGAKSVDALVFTKRL